jgi:hypothetical protein
VPIKKNLHVIDHIFLSNTTRGTLAETILS